MIETGIEPNVNGTASTSTGLLESLAERLGALARATTIYGEPVDREGVTVIPVARAMWGFGGGVGRDDEHEVGSGGGGGMIVSPVGHIEIQGGETSFRPIFKPPIVVISVIVGMALGLVLGRVTATRRRT